MYVCRFACASSFILVSRKECITTSFNSRVHCALKMIHARFGFGSGIETTYLSIYLSIYLYKLHTSVSLHVHVKYLSPYHQVPGVSVQCRRTYTSCSRTVTACSVWWRRCWWRSPPTAPSAPSPHTCHTITRRNSTWSTPYSGYSHSQNHFFMG